MHGPAPPGLAATPRRVTPAQPARAQALSACATCAAPAGRVPAGPARGARLVEQRQHLAGGQAQRGRHVVQLALLQAQRRQDGRLPERQAGRQAAREVRARERRQQVQDQVVVHQLVCVRLARARLLWREGAARFWGPIGAAAPGLDGWVGTQVRHLAVYEPTDWLYTRTLSQPHICSVRRPVACGRPRPATGTPRARAPAAASRRAATAPRRRRGARARRRARPPPSPPRSTSASARAATAPAPARTACGASALVATRRAPLG